MNDKQPVREDIFDKIMQIPILRIFEPFYKKHKEVLLYLFFGGLTFLISIASFALFMKLGMGELIANVLSWIIAVTFAYVTNRIWVFQSHCDTVKDFLKEITGFFGGRLITLGVEELILFLFVTVWKRNAIVVKIIAQIIVILLNYVISKLFVFVDVKTKNA